MDGRTPGVLVVLALSSSCLRADDQPLPFPNLGLCFLETRSAEVPAELADARWIAGDLDADGFGDMAVLEGSTRWTLHPLFGSPGDVPFLLAAPVVIDLGIPLDEARIVFTDANGDGETDLATYHDERIFIVEGPLTGVPNWAETEIPGLSPRMGEFVDFDEDGVLDFVMREGTGDNLVNYRGLADGGFELFGSAEFHEDTFCISQILAEDREDDWFIVVANDPCIVPDRVRVGAFTLNPDGSMFELAAQEFDMDLFDRELTLRMVGNLLSGAHHEVLINDTIWAVEGTSLAVQEESLSSTRRGDFNGDGVLDHVSPNGARVDLHYGGDRGISHREDVKFVGLEGYESRELLETTDVDGNGIDDVTMLQRGVDGRILAVAADTVSMCEQE